jgi:F0F1-type ATP synthase assembly protein I
LNDKNPLTDYAEYLSLGAEIAIGLAAPILIGYWLDEYFNTSPWILLVGCVVGIINIFLIIFHLAKRLEN